MNPVALKIIEIIGSQLKDSKNVDDHRTPCGAYELFTSSLKDPLHFWQLVFALLYPTDDTLEYEVNEQKFLHSQNPGSPEELTSVIMFRFVFDTASVSFYGNSSSVIAKFSQCYRVTLRTMDVLEGKTIQMSLNGAPNGKSYRVIRSFNFNSLCEKIKLSHPERVNDQNFFIEQALKLGYIVDPEGAITLSQKVINYQLYLVAANEQGSVLAKA